MKFVTGYDSHKEKVKYLTRVRQTDVKNNWLTKRDECLFEKQIYYVSDNFMHLHDTSPLLW